MLRAISKPQIADRKNYAYQDNFSGGLNTYFSDVNINDNQLSDCLNVMPDENGIIKTRFGCVALGSPLPSRTRGLGVYYKVDGTRFRVAMSGTALYKYNSVTEVWDAITGKTYTSDLQADFAQGGNYLFIQNGTDALSKFNGSTIADQANGQIGAGIIFARSRLITWGDTSNPSRIYLSGTSANVGDFSSGNGGEFIDVNKDDGQKVTSVAKYGEDLLIYKDYATYKLTFDSNGLPVISLVNPERGAITHRAVDNVEDDVFVMTRQPGVFSQGFRANFLNQIRSDEVSLFISSLIESIQPSMIDQVAAIYFQRRYYLAFAEAGQTANNRILMYDAVTKSWWLWNGWSVNSFTVYADTDGVQHFYFGSDTDGQVYEISETATDDAGVAINSSMTSKAYAYEKFDVFKRINWIDFLFKNIKGTLNISVYLDSDTSSVSKTIGALSGRMGIGTGLFGRIFFGVDPSDAEVTSESVSRPKRLRIREKSRTFKFKLSTNGVGHRFSLLQIAVEYKYKSPRLFTRSDIIN
jgi:hypothetical protein